MFSGNRITYSQKIGLDWRSHRRMAPWYVSMYCDEKPLCIELPFFILNKFLYCTSCIIIKSYVSCGGILKLVISMCWIVYIRPFTRFLLVLMQWFYKVTLVLQGMAKLYYSFFIVLPDGGVKILAEWCPSLSKYCGIHLLNNMVCDYKE